MACDDRLALHERWLVWRRREDLNQVQAARHLGVTRDVYARCERGEADCKQLGPLLVPRCGTTLAHLKAHERCLIYRVRASKTQAQVAADLHVSRATINALERGRGGDCTDLVCYWEA